MSLLGKLELDLTIAEAHQADWSGYYEAVRNRGELSVERALIAAGMSPFEADELCNTGLGNPQAHCLRQYTRARNACRKLERRIAGLKRWQTEEVSA